MNKIFIILILLLNSIIVLGQTTTVNYNTNFATSNQNLWKQGTDGLFEIHKVLFDYSWNKSGKTGSITSIAGFKFGAEVSAGTWGQVASGFDINFGTEKVNINYNTQNLIIKPTDFNFDPGDRITLNTSFDDVSGCNISAAPYNLNMNLWLKFGMGIDLTAKVCAFDCKNIEIVDIDLPVDTYDMITISSLNGISMLDGALNWPASTAFPFQYVDPEGITTTDVVLPSNQGATISVDGTNKLHSFVDPSDPYFNLYFSIPAFIGSLNIPYVSAFFGNLSNEFESGPFYVKYMLMEGGPEVRLFHKQHLVFNPEILGKFSFPTEVNYKIVNPSNNQLISQGHAAEIDYTVGNDVQIDFPCNYDFMKVTPSYYIDNTFTNHTYDSIALDFVLEMLEFNMGVSPMEVIPRLCGDFPYPCPTLTNPLRICWEEVCTPAVNYDGINYGFGPLFEWQPNLFEVKYDWCNNSWKMEGFNSYENMSQFVLQPRKFDVALITTAVSCYGESTGTATATVTNGTPPYTFEWSNGVVVTTNQISNTQTNLISGLHYVTVRDAGTCSVFDSENVLQPDAPLFVSHNIDNPLCFNSIDGSIQITTSGGTPAYSYSWDNGEATANLSNIDAGDYTLTLTDNNGCEIIETYSLTKPEAITSEISAQDVSCKGDNTGSIVLETNGGIAPYIYSWSNSNTTNSDYNLSADTYNITITDFNNCIQNETVVISEPAQVLSSVLSITDISCYGDSSGQINVTANGGTSPYSYKWFNSNFNIINQTGSQLSGMPVGNYTLVLSDNLNCTDSVDMTIIQPESLHYVFDVIDVLCYGEANGEIQLTLSGATNPYSYLWSNGETTSIVTDLYAGDYTVEVTDDNGCEYELNTEISQPEQALRVSTKTTNVLCFGESTGDITALANGGTSPYYFLWSNGSTDQTLVNISAGTYTLTTTDANNCMHFTGGVVTEPEAALSINSTTSDVSCFGYEDGIVDINIFGGTLPYTMTWDNNIYHLSSNQQIIENLIPGIYNIMIVDSNECLIVENFLIETPEIVLINLNSTIVSCYDGSDGRIIPSISGGTEPYSYLWSTGVTTEELSDVSSGIYVLNLTDNNGCEYSASKEVISYPEIIVDSEIKTPSCKDIEDGLIVLEVSGGTENFYFDWSNGEVTKNIYELSSGEYSVLIKDDYDCEVGIEFYVPYAYNGCVVIPNTFTPNNDGINDTWIIPGIKEYSNSTVQIFNLQGNLVYDCKNGYIPWDGTYNGNSMPSGNYYYIIKLNDEDNETSTGAITIIR